MTFTPAPESIKPLISLSYLQWQLQFVDQQVQARTGTTGLTQRAFFIQAVGHAFLLHTSHTHTLACATLLTNYSRPTNKLVVAPCHAQNGE